METEENEEVTAKQLTGRKKKKLFSKIKTQMEFYFSDSNLSKDKFLSDLIEKDPEGYVDLEIFKSFNKIKSLTTDVDIISAALSKSDILKVNEENNKVQRVTPRGPPKDYDSCTIYVEKLPPYADHKWIKDVFEHFGVVDHINIPRYKITDKIKGFAFVEFNNSESAVKACEYYCSSSSKAAENEEENVEGKHGKNIETEDGEEKNPRKRKISEIYSVTEKGGENISTKSTKDFMKNETDTGTTINTEDDEEKSPRKRKISNNSLTEKGGENISTKSTKDSIKNETDTGNEKLPKSSHSSRKRKRENFEEEKLSKKPNLSKDVISDHEEINKVDQEEKKSAKGNSSAVEADMNSEDETPGKSKRKRKHKKKNHSQAERPLLRVMSKQEWKVYRNKYIALQRATMSLLKNHIMLETQKWKEEHETTARTDSHKKGIQFQSGIIIQIKLKDPIQNASDIKDQVKANAVVAYIDAPLGHSEMFVRCHSHDEAQSIIQEGKLQNLGSVELLGGAEEEEYWKKIESDRKIRFSMPPVKKRGRDKILAKALKLSELKNKHIYFDD